MVVPRPKRLNRSRPAGLRARARTRRVRSIFVAKPYTRGALLAAVRAMLDGDLADETGDEDERNGTLAASAAR